MHVTVEAWQRTVNAELCRNGKITELYQISTVCYVSSPWIVLDQQYAPSVACRSVPCVLQSISRGRTHSITDFSDISMTTQVRGTPYNTGDGLALARCVGARLTGDFAGCHSTCWDANAPDDRGDRVLSNQFTKSGYPLGLMLNARGVRFVDEGEDFRNYTYAKFGREIMAQPGGYAFQLWDSTMVPWLRKEEYADDVVERIWGDTIEELATKLLGKGLEDKDTFVQTVGRYNDAARAFKAEHPDARWDPAVKDDMSTQSQSLPVE